MESKILNLAQMLSRLFFKEKTIILSPESDISHDFYNIQSNQLNH